MGQMSKSWQSAEPEWMMLNFDLILPAGGHLADIKTLQLATHCNLYTLHCTIHTLHPLYTFYMHSTHITLHCRSSITTALYTLLHSLQRSHATALIQMKRRGRGMSKNGPNTNIIRCSLHNSAKFWKTYISGQPHNQSFINKRPTFSPNYIKKSNLELENYFNR